MYITLAHPDLITSALGLAHWGERGQGNTLSARTPVSPPSMSVGSITETSVPTLLCLAVRLCSSVLCAVSSVFGEARDMWSNKMAFLLLCTKRESCLRSFDPVGSWPLGPAACLLGLLKGEGMWCGPGWWGGGGQRNWGDAPASQEPTRLQMVWLPAILSGPGQPVPGWHTLLQP